MPHGPQANVTPPPPATARRYRLVLIGVVILAALAVAWPVWRWYTAPVPPVVTFVDVDPAVVNTIEAARRDVRDSPRSPAAWGRLGELLRAHGYMPQSNECFRQAERLDPADARWPYLQGVALQTDDPEAAIGHLERAVAVCGNTPDAPRLTLAEVYFQQGRLDEAEAQFRQILQADPGNVRAHLGLGRLTMERGNARGAVADLERSAASRLTEKASRALLAQAYQQLGDAAAANRERERAHDLPPDPPWPDQFQEEVLTLMIGKQARLSRLQTLQRQGRMAEAQELADQVEKDYPDVYWLVEGRSQLSRGNVAAAEQALRKAVELAPDSIDAWFDLGNLLFEQRDYAGAADCFRKVTEVEPSYGPAHLRLGRCLEARGDRAGAIRAYQAAVRYMPQQAEAHRELGTLLAREGHADEAAEELRQALRLQPTDTKAKELLDDLSRRKP